MSNSKPGYHRARSTPPLPTWNAYFMQFAQVAKTRGNCLLSQVGSVLIRDKQIIATGYNGTPKGVTNCLDGGCSRCLRKSKGLIRQGEEKGSCLCVHAEINTLLQCAYHGIVAAGSTLYTTLSPCLLCAKEIINAGVQEVYYSYHDPDERESLALLKKHLKKVTQIS